MAKVNATLLHGFQQDCDVGSRFSWGLTNKNKKIDQSVAYCPRHFLRVILTMAMVFYAFSG